MQAGPARYKASNQMFSIFKIFFFVVFIFHSASRTPLEISPENFLVSYWANNL